MTGGVVFARSVEDAASIVARVLGMQRPEVNDSEIAVDLVSLGAVDRCGVIVLNTMHRS